jgi:hypothetical protein
MITIAFTPLVINQPTDIQVLITNPNYSPLPTGEVTLDFGDGSDPVPLTISTTRVETTHSYTAPGQFTIWASYSGDSNFAPGTASLTAVSVLSVPSYTLNTFGDSLTGVLPGTWPVLLIGVLGWPRNNYACGGCKTNDMAPSIYNSVVDEKFASTWLLGQDDGADSPLQQSQFQHATLAENSWLAIPEGSAKLRAQDSAITQSGSWETSDFYTTIGLKSLARGSTLTASVPGSTIYIGLTSSPTTDYTADILIDGVDQGTASPVSDYPGENYVPEPYGLRYVVGGSRTSVHIVQVVCTNPGTSGCYADWVGGNGVAARPNLPPYVWTGVTYHTLQSDPLGSFATKNQIVRKVESELESDGLSIRIADIAALFYGPAEPQCVGDGVHPNACGNQIEETVWLSAMSYLATEAQRIDIGQSSPVVVGVPGGLTEATTTSGLPVSYTVISGSGTISERQLTASAPGTLMIQADQSGDSTFLPAQSVRFSVLAILPTTTSLSGSSANPEPSSGLNLTANVMSDGSSVPVGLVTFYDGASVLGSSPINDGIARFITGALNPSKNHVLTASYAQNSQYAASTSLPIECHACAAIIFAKEH